MLRLAGGCERVLGMAGGDEREVFARRLAELLEVSRLTQEQVASQATIRLVRVAKERNDPRPKRVTDGMLSAWVTCRNLPSTETVLLVVVRVLIEHAHSRGIGASEVSPGLLDEGRWPGWLADARAGGERVSGEDVVTGFTVGTVSPLLLGVHVAPAAPGTGDVLARPEPLPQYLPREHDRVLRDLIRQAADPAGPGESVFVVLTGESSVGKTRALHEALLAEVPGWLVFAPQDAGELVRLLESGRVEPGAVLWLDEAQRHLDGAAGARAAALLERMLYAAPGMLVAGALWEKPYWQELTGQGRIPDASADARRLLTGSRTHRIQVPDHLEPDEQRAFRDLAAQPGERFDRRVEHALAAGAADGRVIQHLTAGPELLDAYLHGGLFTQVERAVLTASVDARRLGHLTPIPAPVLAHGADGYLQPWQRPGDIAECETAVDALATGKRQDGTRADVRQALTALTAIRARTGGDPCYEPDNLLLQHVQDLRRGERVPAALWEALARYISNPQDRVRLARRAFDRGLYRLAVTLLEPAARAGDDVEAMNMLANVLGDTGHKEEADAWRCRASSLQDWDAEASPLCVGIRPQFYEDFGRTLLQISIRQCPDHEVWQQWIGEWRRWANGDPPADGTSYDLPPEVLAQCRPELLTQGKPEGWDDHNDAEFVARAIALYYAGVARAGLTVMVDLRDTLLTIYDPEHPYVATTWPNGTAISRGRGNLKADEEHWESRAASGDVAAMRILARLAVLDGHLDEARQWLQQATGTCDTGPMGAAATKDLAHLLERAGRHSEASQLLRHAADAGNLDASCEILDSQGRGDEARQLLRYALETGDFTAEPKLIEQLKRSGRSEEAERLLRFGIEPGGSTAGPW